MTMDVELAGLFPGQILLCVVRGVIICSRCLLTVLMELNLHRDEYKLASLRCGVATPPHEA